MIFSTCASTHKIKFACVHESLCACVHVYMHAFMCAHVCVSMDMLVHMWRPGFNVTSGAVCLVFEIVSHGNLGLMH